MNAKLIFLTALLTTALRATANQQPPEIFLTPARAAALSRITSRPYIVAQSQLPDGRVVSVWTNGLHGAVTTQRVEHVLGKPARSAWRDRLDESERNTQEILDELQAIRGNPSRKAIDNILERQQQRALKRPF